jgi:hypothetical protein
LNYTVDVNRLQYKDLHAPELATPIIVANNNQHSIDAAGIEYVIAPFDGGLSDARLTWTWTFVTVI